MLTSKIMSVLLVVYHYTVLLIMCSYFATEVQSLNHRAKHANGRMLLTFWQVSYFKVLVIIFINYLCRSLLVPRRNILAFILAFV